jgi:uncharacterized protein YbcV (DUF1398 family)
MSVPQSIREVVEACSKESQAGTSSFGQIVTTLMAAGVETYQADFRSKKTTYYLPTGETVAVDLLVPDTQVEQHFSVEKMQEAVRGAQAGRVKYPEFLQLSLAAGCVGYFVWIAGRHVSYFGRRGESHIEYFPPQAV